MRDRTRIASLLAQKAEIEAELALLGVACGNPIDPTLEKAVMDYETELQSIIDGSPGLVFVKDLEYRFVLVNKRLEGLLGIPKEELWGKTDFDIFPPLEAEYYRAHDRRVVENGETVQIEEVANLPDGQHIFLAYKFPLYDSNGRMSAVAAISTDITERVRAEQELERLLASRSEFLSVCSHELRSPLTVLLANIELLKERYGLLSDDQRSKFLAIMANQGKKLDRLVGDLLDVTRIESGHLAINPVPTPLHEIIPRIVSDFDKNCPSHNVLFGPTNIKCSASVDAMRFEQILTNLLSNATKYSPEETRVLVGLGVTDGMIEITVTDQGIGIPPEARERIFERYYRHHSSSYSTGIGVGLYITSQLVQLHGGTISVESLINKGSTFRVRLPRLT